MQQIIPPIKCQGIKTKIVSLIKNKVPSNYNTWYEPFMGSGVVGFNLNPKKAVFSDTNPHIINFYNDLKYKRITHYKVYEYLQEANLFLLKYGENYYKEIRANFNKKPNSLDFLFLNRCCFNGMIRFNSKGNFNVPFCKKNNRFAKSYITKIVNQVKNIEYLISINDYNFYCDTFENIINKAKKDDIIYCDPPYIDRYSDYFNSWNETDENNLFELLNKTKSFFILSTWHHNEFRQNKYIDSLWGNFKIQTINHFYHLGAHEYNRHKMIEALITNF